MDIEGLTSVPAVGDVAALYREVGRLRDKEAIRALAALYSITRDDDDLDSLVSLYTESGEFVHDGIAHVGTDELRRFYRGTMTRYRTSLHTTHTHLVELDGDTASGIVTGHAELADGSVLLLAAYRYDDLYLKSDDQWRFTSRTISFMYTMPFDDMGKGFRDEWRMKRPGEDARSAEIPERLESYARFRAALAFEQA